jgi:hypothetical protein
MEETDYLTWSRDDLIELTNYVSQFPNQLDQKESYQERVDRLAAEYPSVAAAKAELELQMALVHDNKK